MRDISLTRDLSPAHPVSVALMLACGVLVVAGVALVVAWGRLGIVAPMSTPDGRVASALSRYLWWVTLVVTTGLVTGLLVAGAGGRLIMRLLAATSPSASGLLTEAGETIGRVSVSGTLGFFVFGALPLALLASFAYAAIHRWLPEGRLAGLLLGVLLLVAASTRLEPLRSDNPDFVLVGPAWVALLTLGLLVLAQGMTTAAFMGWYSRRLPPLQRDRKVVARFVLTGAMLVLTGPTGALVLALALAGAALVTVAVLIAPGFSSWWLSSRTSTVGRVLLAGGILLALPGFVIAIDDILQ
ncbi:MAG: hypothetical protein ABI662_04465 [Dermatophilaceae bacterium]